MCDVWTCICVTAFINPFQWGMTCSLTCCPFTLLMLSLSLLCLCVNDSLPNCESRERGKTLKPGRDECLNKKMFKEWKAETRQVHRAVSSSFSETNQSLTIIGDDSCLNWATVFVSLLLVVKSEAKWTHVLGPHYFTLSKFRTETKHISLPKSYLTNVLNVTSLSFALWIIPMRVHATLSLFPSQHPHRSLDLLVICLLFTLYSHWLLGFFLLCCN